MSRSYPGITRRVDQYGRARYRARVRRGDQRLSATFPTIEEALAWQAQAISAVERSIAPPPARPAPVAHHDQPVIFEAATRLVRGMRDGSAVTNSGEAYKPSVVRKYEAALRLDVVPSVGAIPVDELTRGDVQRLVDEIGRSASVDRAAKALVALRVVLRQCERYGEIEANPCRGVSVPRRRDEERPARVLTVAEVERLLAAAQADDERLKRSLAHPLVLLAAFTGARLGELLALAWGPTGLDLDQHRMTISRSLDRYRDEQTRRHQFITPKSRASRRGVPLDQRAVAGLRAHRLASGRPADGELVFSDVLGRPLIPQSIPRHLWLRTLDRAKLADPQPRFHDLRHAWASHALASGLGAHAVAKLLGHSDAGLVWQRYGHALPDELAGAADRIASWRHAAMA